jgi:glycosyltransferase involved in cell wall biosynthesis
MLDAYQELREQHPEYRLHLMMSDKKVKIPEGIPVFPSVPHSKVAGFLQDCDVLVVPRPDNPVNRTTYPSKLNEYLAMGKTVIASRIADMDVVITHMDNGVLFDPGDTEGFKQALLSVRDQEVREKLGNRAFEVTKEKYTWDIQGRRFKNLLSELVQST